MPIGFPPGGGSSSGSSNPVLAVLSCPSGVAVNDAVYQLDDGTCNQADASDPTKMPVIGFVDSKPSATSAIVRYAGELAGLSGLSPSETYFADPAVPGGITLTPPTAPADSGDS